MKVTLAEIKSEVVRLFRAERWIKEHAVVGTKERSLEIFLDKHVRLAIHTNSKAKARSFMLDLLRYLLTPEETSTAIEALALAAQVSNSAAMSTTLDGYPEKRGAYYAAAVKFEALKLRLERFHAPF